jgi:3-dehydro-L-gulonate 2-dehydrogenase
MPLPYRNQTGAAYRFLERIRTYRLVLDMLATLLSGGNSTSVISQSDKKETGVSQVFICIKADQQQHAALIEEVISYAKSSAVDGDNEILYPGENMLRTRERNLQEGVLVDKAVWEKVLGM